MWPDHSFPMCKWMGHLSPLIFRWAIIQADCIYYHYNCSHGKETEITFSYLNEKRLLTNYSEQIQIKTSVEELDSWKHKFIGAIIIWGYNYDELCWNYFSEICKQVAQQPITVLHIFDRGTIRFVCWRDSEI